MWISLTKRAASWVALVAGLTAMPASAQSDPSLGFERSVWPILVKHCTACHGGDAPKGNLDLQRVTAIVRGGDSGAAAVGNQPDVSPLWQRIENDEMPPGDRRKLTDAEKQVVRAWIAAGLPADHPDETPPPPPPVSETDRRHWAFRPLARPATPAVANASAPATPIDAFLLSRLEDKGLTFSPEADPITLTRRAYLDLTGLPPSLAEVDARLADEAPGGYERMIDRLLASPHFGERWGRHWLDVAGYVDTVGFDVDANLIITSEGKWRYRDYVIRAFNEDKPYDQFITEQLAGDELHDWRRAERFTPEMLDSLVATGFLRTARDLTHEDVGVIPQNFFGIVDDTIEIVGTGLLGLTVNCARCHSHKFDPIPQEDYYRLMALFAPAYNPLDWRPVIAFDGKVRERALPDVSPAQQAEMEGHNRIIDERVGGLQARVAELRRPQIEAIKAARLATLPEAIRADTQTAIEKPTEQRNEVQKYLAQKFEALLTIKPEEADGGLNDADRAAVRSFEAEIAAANAQRRAWGKIQALVDLGPPPPTHLLVRGDYKTPGPEVAPGFLRVLSRDEADALVQASPPAEGTSGRRLALARWLTDRQSPASGLLARVLVNRLWEKAYGRGLVPTADNFGLQGRQPTHPELLEWLAAELVESGWRIKPLLRTMMTSAAYRQASRRTESADAGALAGIASAPGTATADSASVEPLGVDPNALDPNVIDPGNKLLWRMPLRRLESEIIRDAILVVSGRLNPAAGGPPVLTDAQLNGQVIVDRKKLAQPEDEFRRSVYLLSRRAYNLSLLTVFDQPQVATNCLARDASAVPLQSLTMLNDEFFSQQASQLAVRVKTTAGDEPQPQIELAYRLALSRRPNAEEAAWCAQFLIQQAEVYRAAGMADGASDQALTQLCHTLLNTSEFLYVE